MATVSHINPLPFCPQIPTEFFPLPETATEIELEDLVTLFWRVKGFTWTNAPTSIGVKIEAGGGPVYVENPINGPEDDYKELYRNFADTNPPTTEKDLVCLQNMYWAPKPTVYIVDEFTEWEEYETSEEGFFSRERYRYEFYLAIRSSFSARSIFNVYSDNNKYYIDFTFDFLQFNSSLSYYIESKGPEEEYPDDENANSTDVGQAFLTTSDELGGSYEHDGNITVNFLDKSLNFPYRYNNDSFWAEGSGGGGGSVGDGFIYLNDVEHNLEEENVNFGRVIMDQITLDATEYWPHNPNDGDGPIYDEDTGEQIRPF